MKLMRYEVIAAVPLWSLHKHATQLTICINAVAGHQPDAALMMAYADLLYPAHVVAKSVALAAYAMAACQCVSHSQLSSSSAALS